MIVSTFAFLCAFHLVHLVHVPAARRMRQGQGQGQRSTLATDRASQVKVPHLALTSLRRYGMRWGTQA